MASQRMTRIIESMTALWQGLDTRARVMIIAAAVLCIGGIVALVNTRSGDGYVVLYTDLDPHDAGEITEKLKTERVPYRLTGGGKTIEVPTGRVYEVRIALARDGLPNSGLVGFEIFDRSNLPGTEFNNRVNFQRALQGELARTISAMDEVAAARVHLVLPEESIFTERTRPSASVVIEPRRGVTLKPEMTAAVARIVASAVEGLELGDVTVADNLGRVLRSPESDGMLSGLTSQQMEIRQQYEETLCRRLQSMLDAVLGEHQAVVRVQARLDFDTEEIKQENIVPLADGRGVVAVEKIREENYEAMENPAQAAGLDPNVGLTAPGEGGRGGTYTHRDETREYQFSRNVSELIRAPGQVKHLTVATIIDESLSRTAEEQVRDILTAAAGVDERRGDVITVERMKIDAAERARAAVEEALAAEQAQRREQMIHTALRSGSMLLIAVMVFVAAMFFARRYSPQETDGDMIPVDAQADAAQAAAVADEQEPTVSENLPATDDEADDHSSLDDENLQEIIGQAFGDGSPGVVSVRERLRDLAERDTEALTGRLVALLDER